MIKPLFENGVDPKYELSSKMRELLEKAEVADNTQEYYARLAQEDTTHSSIAWFLSSTLGKVGSADEGYPLEDPRILVNGETKQFHPRIKELTGIEEAARIISLRKSIFGPEGALSKDPETKQDNFVMGKLIDPTHYFLDARRKALILGRDLAVKLNEPSLPYNYINANLAIAKRYLVLGQNPQKETSTRSFYIDIGIREHSLMDHLYAKTIASWQTNN